MFRKFANLSLNELVESLSDRTLSLSRIQTLGGQEMEYIRVKREILELQQEIVRRKESEDSDLDNKRSYPDDRASY